MIEIIYFADGSIVRGIVTEAESGITVELQYDYPDVQDGTFVWNGNEYEVKKRDGRTLTCEA